MPVGREEDGEGVSVAEGSDGDGDEWAANDGKNAAAVAAATAAAVTSLMVADVKVASSEVGREEGRAGGVGWEQRGTTEGRVTLRAEVSADFSWLC